MPDLPLPEKDTGDATASDCGTAPDTERELPASGPAETHPALPEPAEAKLPESPLERGVAFDRAGFLPGVGEAAETFFRRVEETLAAHRAFEEELAAAGELVVFEDIRVSEAERIPAEIIAAVGVFGEHGDGRAVQHDFAQLFCARREFHRVYAHVDYMSFVWEFAF